MYGTQKASAHIFDTLLNGHDIDIVTIIDVEKSFCRETKRREKQKNIDSSKKNETLVSHFLLVIRDENQFDWTVF